MVIAFRETPTKHIGPIGCLARPKLDRATPPAARKPGNCWPLAGKTGNVGVILRGPVYVTGMTLEHMEWERCSVKDAAPKFVIFWSRIMEPKYYKKAVLEASKALGERPGLVQAPKMSKPRYDYVKVEYELTESSHRAANGSTTLSVVWC